MVVINIITYNNNYGLTHDYTILKTHLLDIFNNNITINFVNFYDYRLPFSNINIFLEILPNILIKNDRLNIFIPNQEWFYKSWIPYLHNLDYIWCKTPYITDIFKKYIDNNKLDYLGWCSNDMISNNSNKNYQQYLHLCGRSIYKQTQTIINCWNENLPKLVIVYSPKDVILQTRNLPNITYIKERVETDDLKKLMNYCGVHICCSETEGFGHYIQEAKSCQSIVITTNAPPMNSFIDTSFGYLIDIDKTVQCKDTLSSKFYINTNHLLDTIQSIQKTSTKILDNMGVLARKSYLTTNNDFKSQLTLLTNKLSNNFKTIPNSISHHPEDYPAISIITPTSNRRRFFKLSLYNFYNINYQKDKIEWIIVEDGNETIKDLIPKDEPRIKFFQLKGKNTIGFKRNFCIDKSTNPIIVCMDDDDYYPPNSVANRVTHLLNNPDKNLVTCTTIGCFHINKYISMINVPPHQFPFENRISEASMAFKKSFWKKNKFNNKSKCSEATDFLYNRFEQCLEISWDDIIVSLLHSSNTSDKVTVSDKPNGCFFGFSDELFLFITSLDVTTTPHNLENNL